MWLAFYCSCHCLQLSWMRLFDTYVLSSLFALKRRMRNPSYWRQQQIPGGSSRPITKMGGMWWCQNRIRTEHEPGAFTSSRFHVVIMIICSTESIRRFLFFLMFVKFFTVSEEREIYKWQIFLPYSVTWVNVYTNWAHILTDNHVIKDFWWKHEANIIPTQLIAVHLLLVTTMKTKKMGKRRAHASKIENKKMIRIIKENEYELRECVKANRGETSKLSRR